MMKMKAKIIFSTFVLCMIISFKKNNDISPEIYAGAWVKLEKDAGPMSIIINEEYITYFGYKTPIKYVSYDGGSTKELFERYNEKYQIKAKGILSLTIKSDFQQRDIHRFINQNGEVMPYLILGGIGGHEFFIVQS